MSTLKEKFTYLQKKEIRAARESGLREEQLKFLENPSFNYQQMKEIRMAMEAGIEETQLKLFARPWIEADEMHAIIEAVHKGEKIEIPRRRLSFPVPRICIFFPSALLGGFFLFRMQQPQEPLRLELASKEITLACGQEFEPAQYVKVQGGTNASLHMPEARKLEHPGTWIFPYEITNGKETIQKLLRVHAVDSGKPVIRLKQKEAVIYKGIPFSCHAYVESAVDDIDGSLSRKVQCSDELEDGDQAILYTVTDSNGNEGRASMEVHYIDPLETEEPMETPGAEPVEEKEASAAVISPPPSPVSTPYAAPQEISPPAIELPAPSPEYTYETETIEQWSEEVQSQEVTVEHSFS